MINIYQVQLDLSQSWVGIRFKQLKLLQNNSLN